MVLLKEYVLSLNKNKTKHIGFPTFKLQQNTKNRL